jgi:hypothetical protein
MGGALLASYPLFVMAAVYPHYLAAGWTSMQQAVLAAVNERGNDRRTIARPDHLARAWRVAEKTLLRTKCQNAPTSRLF